jgi:hypothetical protein
LAKLEIERQYWLARGVVYKILTEKQLSEILVENIRYVRKSVSLVFGHLSITEQEFVIAKKLLREALSIFGQIPAVVANQVDSRMGFEVGTSLAIVKHLLACREIRVDFYKTIHPRKPLPLIVSGGAV